MDPVIHFEVPFEDQERIVRFYGAVFGWRMQALGKDMGDYVLVTTTVNDTRPGSPSGAINGGLFPKDPARPIQGASIVIGVANLEESMAKIIDAGGEILGEPMEIQNVGRYVSFLDTEGNCNSMLQTKP